MADNNHLVVLTFEGSKTAATVYAEIERMEKEKLLEVEDAIIIERGEEVAMRSSMAAYDTARLGSTGSPIGLDDSSVRVVQTHRKKGKYAAKGGGIGLLAGFLLGGPVGGLIVGVTLGAVTGAMKDLGIDDKNIATIKARLQPNSSALLVLGHANDRDAFLDRLRTYDPQVVSTTLTPEVERELRTRLGSS